MYLIHLAGGHSLFGGMPAGYGHPLSSAYSAMMGGGGRSGATSGYPGPHSVPTTSSYGSLGTLSVAASQAASLGINPASKFQNNFFLKFIIQDKAFYSSVKHCCNVVKTSKYCYHY